MSEKSRKSALGIIFLTVFIDLVGFGIIIPLSPYLAREFNATPFEIGLLMSVYSLMQFLLSPFWGRISDRVGRRPIILLSLLGSTLSYLGFAFATTLVGLFIARIFAGIFGASVSTASAYIADVTPPEKRSKSMGLIGAAFGLGFVFGPAIGGLVGDIGLSLGAAPPYGMSFASLVAASICGLNFLLALRILKESLPKEMRGAKERPSRFKQIKAHISQPVVGPLLLVLLLTTLAMANMESTLFLLVQDVFSWDVKTASYGFVYVGVMIAFTQGFLVRRLMPKLGERKLLFIGLIFSTVGMLGIAYSSSIYQLGIVITLVSIGTGLTHPSVLGSISLKTDGESQGSVMGVGQSLSALGRIIGPAVGGWAYGSVSIQSPYYLAGLLMLMAFLMVVMIFSQLPQTGKASA